MSVTKLATSAYLLLLFVSAMIVLLPEPPADPLVARNAWKVQGVWFQPARGGPNEIEARGTILSSPDTIIHSSYSPSTNVTQGRITSAPFEAPPVIAIPFKGFPFDFERKIDFYLECLENGARHTVARANTNVQWSEAVFAIREDWCKSEITLNARTDSKHKLLAFGTPFAVSPPSYLKTRGIGQIFIHFAVFAFLFQVGLMGVLIWGRLGLPGAAFTVQIITIGILGYATFFVMYFSSGAGLILAWSLILGAPIVITAFLFFDPPFFKEKVSCLKWVTIIWFSGSLCFVLLLYSIDNGGGSWSSNYRFSPANWSSDNQLSLHISQALVSGKDIKDFSMGSWLVSDRPQLLTGIVCLLRPLLLFLYSNNDGPHLYHHAYHITGITMMSLWLPAVLFLLSRVGLTTRRHQLFILLIIALSPLSLSNSTYISPKMLSGAFGVMAFSYLLAPVRVAEEANHHRRRSLDHALMAAAILSVLSLMSHGGGFFAIVTMGLWGLVAFFLGRIRAIVLSGSLGLLLLAPWLLWQKLVQPPGNALVKFAFAGTYGFKEKEVGLLDTILRAYSDARFIGWLELRWQALLALFGAGDAAQAGRIIAARLWAEGTVDILRMRDQYFLFPVMIGFILISAAVLLLRRRVSIAGAENKVLASVSCRMIGVAVASYMVTVFFLWEKHFIFVFPYPAHILLLSGSLSGLLAFGKQRVAVGVGLMLGSYSTLVWILDPVIDAIRVDWFSLGVLLCCLLLVITGLFRRDQLSQ